MPRYQYACTTCHAPREFDCAIQDRDHQDCHQCGDRLVRRYSTPHIAPIGGIYNRLNANWNEDGNVTVDSELRSMGLEPEEIPKATS